MSLPTNVARQPHFVTWIFPWHRHWPKQSHEIMERTVVCFCFNVNCFRYMYGTCLLQCLIKHVLLFVYNFYCKNCILLYFIVCLQFIGCLAVLPQRLKPHPQWAAFQSRCLCWRAPLFTEPRPVQSQAQWGQMRYSCRFSPHWSFNMEICGQTCYLIALVEHLYHCHKLSQKHHKGTGNGLERGWRRGQAWVDQALERVGSVYWHMPYPNPFLRPDPLTWVNAYSDVTDTGTGWTIADFLESRGKMFSYLKELSSSQKSPMDFWQLTTASQCGCIGI